MTPKQLAAASGAPMLRAEEWHPYLEASMLEYDINTPARQAMFLAQVGHESGGFKYAVEIWGPTPAQSRYEGRADLGNNKPGDGSRFRGRGLIQVTGRHNYQELSDALDIDFITTPELLAKPGYAAMSAAWWWKHHGLNEIADSGDFIKATKRINGGINGLADRQARYAVATEVLA